MQELRCSITTGSSKAEANLNQAALQIIIHSISIPSGEPALAGNLACEKERSSIVEVLTQTTKSSPLGQQLGLSPLSSHHPGFPSPPWLVLETHAAYYLLSITKEQLTVKGSDSLTAAQNQTQ